MQMTKKIKMTAIALLMASTTLLSCGPDVGIGDRRDRNLERSMLAYLDSIQGVEYVGMSDTHDLDDDRFQTVVIYYVADSAGNRVECNALVTTNGDCSEIYSWEALESQKLTEVKQKINKKLDGKGFGVDGSLIDALIELKKQAR